VQDPMRYLISVDISLNQSIHDWLCGYQVSQSIFQRIILQNLATLLFIVEWCINLIAKGVDGGIMGLDFNDVRPKSGELGLVSIMQASK
jgi:hypothetical protein